MLTDIRAKLILIDLRDVKAKVNDATPNNDRVYHRIIVANEYDLLIYNE